MPASGDNPSITNHTILPEAPTPAPAVEPSFDLEKELEKVRTNPPAKHKKKLMNPDPLIDARQRREDAEALYQWQRQETNAAEKVFRQRIADLERQLEEERRKTFTPQEQPMDEAAVKRFRLMHVRFNFELVIRGTKVKDTIVLAKECTNLQRLLDRAEDIFKGYLKDAGISMPYNLKYVELQTSKLHGSKTCKRYQHAKFARWLEKHVLMLNDKRYFNITIYFTGGELQAANSQLEATKGGLNGGKKDDIEKLFFSSSDEESESD